MALLERLAGSWKATGLRNRLLYTLFMLLVFRIGVHVPVPGIDTDKVAELLTSQGLLGFIDVISGGAFRTFSIFAMSVAPYINASIIMQLLTVVIPKLEEMQKEGEQGRKKIQQYTRYGTVVLGLVQALGMTLGLVRGAMIRPESMLDVAIIIITLTAGTAFLMWMGEQITEKGIGNGISLLIFFGIVSRIPGAADGLWALAKTGNVGELGKVLLLLAAGLLIVAFTVMVTEGIRRIPVQYAKRVVGRRMYGGQTTYLPLKINQAGVIPVIFATSLLLFPTTVTSFFPQNHPVVEFVNTWFGTQGYLYLLLLALLTFFFTFFYTEITFNPGEIANNIKKQGGFIPGIRPGKPTTEYLQRISGRITFAGATFLALIMLIPYAIIAVTQVPYAAIGGTALLIVVGVALETMRQIEAHMVMRNYQGFMK